MLERLLEQTAPVHAVLSDSMFTGKTDRILLYTTNDQVNIESIVQFLKLKPFKDATVSLSREDEPTLPAILPVMIKLEKHLTVQDSESSMIKEMKTKALENLKKRNLCPEQRKALSLASLLHPRSKHLHFLSEDEKHLAHAHLHLEIASAKNPQPPQNNVPTLKVESNSEVSASQFQEQLLSDTLQEVLDEAPVLEVNEDTKAHISQIASTSASASSAGDYQPPVKKPKPDLMEWLDEIFFPSDSQTKNVEESSINREIDLYLSADSSTEGALNWWKQNHVSYPNVAKTAKKYLCVPASSVPSERIFSLCGNILNKKRASLAPENLDMLVFLNKNYKKI